MSYIAGSMIACSGVLLHFILQALFHLVSSYKVVLYDLLGMGLTYLLSCRERKSVTVVHLALTAHLAAHLLVSPLHLHGWKEKLGRIRIGLALHQLDMSRHVGG